MSNTWRQVSVVHLSDIHFDACGRAHRFHPVITPSGDPATEDSFPSLADALKADLKGPRRGHPVVVAITGDLTEKAKPEEFSAAERLIRELTSTPILGVPLSSRDVFVVPGNHDVVWDSTGPSRWDPYCAFRRSVFGDRSNSAAPDGLTRVHDRSQDLGLVVAEVNSCAFVQKKTKDAQRGRISTAALKELDASLSAINGRGAIRIALMHHHPVLLPAFGEPDRGYDSIILAGHLLSILRKHRFQLVLHGHKHLPYTFSYDASCPWSGTAPPMLILAGGSAGAKELPSELQAATNTYNEITIKWHPSAGEGRVRVDTRKLVAFDDHGAQLLPQDWRWAKLRTTYHPLRFRPQVPRAGRTERVQFDEGAGVASEKKRLEVCTNLRGNMPVAEITPSMDSGQGYDARLWIEPHNRTRKTDVPVEVVWSCGPKFRLARCNGRDNPSFAVTISYYGPMLVQARMRFADGFRAAGYVYVRMPGRDANRLAE